MELHLINWNYQETAMYIDIAHVEKNDLRLPSVKRSSGKQRNCYHAFKDWNALDSDLKNSDTIYQFRRNFFFNLEFTNLFLNIF